MSHLRPETSDPALLRTFGLDIDAGTIEPPQSYGWHQLATAVRGRATLRTEATSFPLLPATAVWLPAGTAYAIELHERVELRVLYLRPDAPSPADLESQQRAELRPGAQSRPDVGPQSTGAFRPAAASLRLTPLLGELIARISALGALDGRNLRQRRLAAVAYDEIAGLEEAGLFLPSPRRALTRRAADLILNSPPGECDAARAAQLCGVNRRTLERAFAAETGMAVAAWSRRARLLAALKALLDGAPVTVVALDAGYATPSGFIAAFKRAFGTSPDRYRAALRRA